MRYAMHAVTQWQYTEQQAVQLSGMYRMHLAGPC